MTERERFEEWYFTTYGMRSPNISETAWFAWKARAALREDRGTTEAAPPKYSECDAMIRRHYPWWPGDEDTLNHADTVRGIVQAIVADLRAAPIPEDRAEPVRRKL